MTRARTAAAETIDPEVLLRRATLARTSGARAKYAQRALSQGGSLDDTTRSMLLRQLYLSHMEAREFTEALGVATQMIDTCVMPDVARQDAARACLGLGDVDGAVQHLRIASRVSPAARRAFHLWTLGTVLYLNGRPEDAVGTLERALRWGTIDKPLYAAQAALARHALGEEISDVEGLREALADAPCGQGYGQFVLGELAFVQGDYTAAHRYLSAFVNRTTTGRVALAVALEGEVRRARRLLRLLRGKRQRSSG
ncbi:MAG: tetratricopeptide repeat protein [Myxococcota bacterium]